MNKYRITYPNNKEVRDDTYRTTNIIISKKKLFRTKEYSLIKLKNNYPSYSNLPDNYHGEDGLKEILEGYRDFLKYIISNKKLLH